jgi:hypothetical protein
MRKTAAVTAVVMGFTVPGAFLAATAAPASAHAGHGAFLQWTAPEDGQQVSGRNFHVRGKLNFGADGVKSYKVEVLAPPANPARPGYGTVCEEEFGGGPSSATIDCVWDTTVYPDNVGASYNGQYTVRVTGTNAMNQGGFSNPSEPHEADRRVTVTNPASAPTGVQLAFSEAERQAVVSWHANPEPDVTSYTIQERVGDSGWKTVGQAGSKVTSFTRQLSAPGTYRYQVAAVRSAGSGTGTLQSSWSGPAAEPKQIVVEEPKPPETTTTTAPGESDNDGGASGSDPGSSPPSPGDPALPQQVVTGAAAPAGGPPPPGAPPAPPGALITRIEAGAPGSVASRQTSNGHLVAKLPGGSETPPEPDPGYVQALPYKAAPPPAAEHGKGDGITGVLVGLPDAISGDSRRQLAIPLAAGLLLFVFAMHALYLSRRAAPDAPLDVD